MDWIWTNNVGSCHRSRAVCGCVELSSRKLQNMFQCLSERIESRTSDKPKNVVKPKIVDILRQLERTSLAVDNAIKTRRKGDSSGPNQSSVPSAWSVEAKVAKLLSNFCVPMELYIDCLQVDELPDSSADCISSNDNSELDNFVFICNRFVIFLWKQIELESNGRGFGITTTHILKCIPTLLNVYKALDKFNKYGTISNDSAVDKCETSIISDLGCIDSLLVNELSTWQPTTLSPNPQTFPSEVNTSSECNRNSLEECSTQMMEEQISSNNENDSNSEGSQSEDENDSNSEDENDSNSEGSESEDDQGCKTGRLNSLEDDEQLLNMYVFIMNFNFFFVFFVFSYLTNFEFDICFYHTWPLPCL